METPNEKSLTIEFTPRDALLFKAMLVLPNVVWVAGLVTGLMPVPLMVAVAMSCLFSLTLISVAGVLFRPAGFANVYWIVAAIIGSTLLLLLPSVMAVLDMAMKVFA